ncbi:uncharacterized protein LOC106962397 [Poecilia latipinna]|uniref:uncharacterized protein LOC106962397 n=1 Tax=Poecilia latipinna TaxID=48699 RepID=UPI00072DEAC1|nr:PREDICTED: uncharacterized protein LOC106962397 [Poecilia latipinna]
MRGARGGKGKSAPSDKEAQTEHEECGAICEEDEEGREPTISDLAGILQAHIGQQKAREEQWEKEMARQDHRFKALQHQFTLFQEELQAQSSEGLRPFVQDHAPSSTGLRPDDVARSPPGPALSAVKPAAILQKYEINNETYRQRFRSLHVEPNESPKELFVRLKELYSKWVQPRGKTVEEINDIIILEQYFRMLSPELQVWIKERNPKDAAEAVSLADAFVAARRKTQSWAFRAAKREFMPIPGNGQTGNVNKQSGKEKCFSPSQTKPVKKPICYLCGQEGHTKPVCPQNPTKLSQMCFVPRENQVVNRQNQPLMETTVEIDGKRVKALIDTGSTQSLVHRRYVPPHSICTSETIPICCVHGDEKQYPTADIFMRVQGHVYLLNVGVMDELPFPVVLGNDLPVLTDLINASKMCNVVLTRSQAKTSGEDEPSLKALPFYEAEIEGCCTKDRKSRAQRKQEKFKHTTASPVLPEPEVQLDFEIPDNISELQHQDRSLADLMKRVEEGETAEEFYMQNGILYRRHGELQQLVLPRKVRKTVLTLGHSVPWAGHLGKHKTIARIKRCFYWPGLHKDVASFCKSCPQCQKTSTRFAARAPLQPLPIINTPFERLGMDVVGPVEKSKSGNRFMLVITDYATKYPEVFPLKSVKAKTVAFCLVQFFSRVGFPKEILTDQGTNFMSKLLKDVYKLIGIRGLRTTPYHPQTDGLTERFNQTLKNMLRKFINEAGSDWDQWLPYLLFAYREVPQASTGFSPFELLFGHEVRGPLALLKERWEGEKPVKEPVNTISYVLQMREKLEKMTSLAKEHMRVSQQKQKTWYDQTAHVRSFEPGQKVLVLQPTDNSKFLAQWQGPYEVVQKLGPTTYKICTPDQRRSTRVLNINLLKEWVSRPEGKQDVFFIRSVSDEEVEEQYLPLPSASVLDLSHLSPEQQVQVRALCNINLFHDNPGRTDYMEHDIRLKEDAVVKQRSYRIPERLLGPLKEEIELMLSLGIIETSHSDWCNPIVLVPKKDGTMRFCIDFRYLNSVSKFDSYPTPRIDDLICCLGKAKYLTTIDLSKGYWQVPLTTRSRELTAFRTPWGLHQFTVMPFGLHGAPATFQRLMDKVLGGLTVNAAKCTLAKKEVQYLGLIIGNGVIKPQIQKVQAIQSCPLPQTRTQLKYLLGMSGWYHKFIPNFSARAAVLTDMTSPKRPNQLQWSEEAERAFKDIQGALSGPPTLHCPDFDQPFILQTDASGRGLGAVLLQGPPGGRHPIAFISRKLYPRETRYSTIEKECLAVKWALDSLKYYLLGTRFILEMDHKALKWLERMKDSNSRITRWYLAMQPFQFDVHHIPGKLNSTADYLSCWPMEFPEEGECVEVPPPFPQC